MFIHIGGDTVVNLQKLIGIFDIRIKDSSIMPTFFQKYTDEHSVEIVESGDIKSCVVTDGKLYYSPISSTTLKKRAFTMDTHGKFEVD